VKEETLSSKQIHVFPFISIFFWRPGSDMVSQNFQVSSDYGCDMLIFVYFPKMFLFNSKE